MHSVDKKGSSKSNEDIRSIGSRSSITAAARAKFIAELYVDKKQASTPSSSSTISSSTSSSNADLNSSTNQNAPILNSSTNQSAPNSNSTNQGAPNSNSTNQEPPSSSSTNQEPPSSNSANQRAPNSNLNSNSANEVIVGLKSAVERDKGVSITNGKNPVPIKKSEEIWVRRAAGGRRSFRVTNLRGQVLPSILTEDEDEGNESHEASVTTWTPGTRNPLQLSDARNRHHSGGGGAAQCKSPKASKTNILLDAFRPRSKSDASRLKKPSFISNIRNAVQNSLLGVEKESGGGGVSGHRARSGSESVARSPVSKVMDIFRTRSSSVNAQDDKRKKHSGSSSSWAHQGARRSSLHSHRPSDVSLDPAHAAILFRDSRGLPLTDPFIERILSLSSEDEENEILVKFFKFHKCYDLIPTSAKLVVFDTQLLVKKAFFALVYNGVRAAPLWDSEERKVVGMLTITDFIRVLHAMYHDSAGTGSKMSELEEHRVETWRKRFLLNKCPLVSIEPDASLYDAICSLVNNRIHRLPVIDKHTGNVLHILTHKRILKFLFLYIHEIPRPSFLNSKLSEVRIGSFENIETAREETPIIAALQKFLERRVSALPIVDDQNRLLDIYARFDVINLAAEKTYNNLDLTLKQANEHRNEWFEGVHKCTLDDTLFSIMEKIVKAEVHRLVVVDSEERVTGVISLSDILQYLVMRPELKEVSVVEIEEAMKNEREAEESSKAAFLQNELDIMSFNSPNNSSNSSNLLLVDSQQQKMEETIFEEDEKT